MDITLSAPQRRALEAVSRGEVTRIHGAIGIVYNCPYKGVGNASLRVLETHWLITDDGGASANWQRVVLTVKGQQLLEGV